MKKQVIVLVLAAVLIFGCAVGGTFAWLSAKTQTIVNTFTYGDVSITLEETNADGGDANANSYKMIPGNNIEKDPTVTVLNGSEDCWVFITVADGDASKYLDYSIDNTVWTELESGVWYTKATNITADVKLNVLTGKIVTVKNNVEASEIEKLQEPNAVLPTLSFTAYAVQTSGFDTAAAAWAVAKTISQ